MANQKRILITGGAGFIGSHLCVKLLNMGNHVICMDNLYTGSKENIAPLLNNPDFEFINHDVVEPYSIQVDEIYNLACPASPIHYQTNPIKTFKTSIFGIYNLLEVAKACNAKILQASTSEVYGDPICHPQREEYWGNVNTLGVRSCYDEGKRGAETLCMDYYRQHKVKIKIIRIFNTYGTNMLPNDGRVISNFILQALNNKDITIYGDGTQTRSFQYIDNLIEGMVRVMATDDSFIGPINLGNPNEFTISELAEKVIELTHSKSKITYNALPSDDPRQRQPDISLAQKIINYNPNIELEKGLEKTISYFKKLNNK